MGEFLLGASPIRVRSGGLLFYARPHSEDLHYLLPSHKATVQSWFRPTRGQTVVDVGAHIGFESILAASLGANVLAIEPNPAAVAILRANARLNHLSNVQVAEVALASREGAAQLEVPEIWDGKASLRHGWAQGGRSDTRVTYVPVRVATLDHVLDAGPIRSIDWLLVDAEGSELEVLRGGQNALTRTRHLLVEVSAGSEAGCRSLLTAEHGFKILSVRRQTSHTEYWVARGPDPPGS